ncbi:hypothetical protein PR202_gb17674 [Eleusine coracana subsp. coracana]|uniref:ABC transporter domain-containing protein n=1 Tax=Eleusine coracana subsp. coracana TaxID=191504 RepID=A0AAV5F3M3_ELECO|nr:hypothetical protein PR202_gb17674 [Eleusine coracana subsp. coracana]
MESGGVRRTDREAEPPLGASTGEAQREGAATASYSYGRTAADDERKKEMQSAATNSSQIRRTRTTRLRFRPVARPRLLGCEAVAWAWARAHFFVVLGFMNLSCLDLNSLVDYVFLLLFSAQCARHAATWILKILLEIPHFQYKLTSPKTLATFMEIVSFSTASVFGLFVIVATVVGRSCNERKVNTIEAPLLPDKEINENEAMDLVDHNLWELLTFKFVNPMMNIGITRQLDFTDLLDLPAELRAASCYEKLMSSWLAEQQNHHENLSLLRAMFGAYGRPYLRLGLLKVYQNLICLTFLFSTLELTIKQCLCLSLAERSRFSEGEVQTLMFVDADRTIVQREHYLYTLPLQAVISSRRLSNYLSTPEHCSSELTAPGDLSNCDFERHTEAFHNPETVVLQNVCCSWSSSYVVNPSIILRDISLQLHKGLLIAIVGEVGSGKSSLLNSIIGETCVVSGSISSCGSISYVPQVPWILSGSLRDNILLGKEFDPVRYEEVIEACALDVDISAMDRGDMSQIREKGANLSGGQRARLALARALYHDSEVYLFDDILSAVDSQVASWILEKAIMASPMKSKTRIISTHNLQAISAADVVVVMANGLTDISLDDDSMVAYEEQTDQSKAEARKEGRVELNVYKLSSDLYTIDDSLPFILNIFVANFFSLLGTLVVLSYSQVSFLLILFPLWLIYNKVQLLAGFIILFIAMMAIVGFQSNSLANFGTPGLVGLALSYAAPVVSLLNGFLTTFTETEKEMISVERVVEYVDIPQEELQGSEPPPKSWPTEGTIVFEHVTLRWKKEIPQVLMEDRFSRFAQFAKASNM